MDDLELFALGNMTNSSAAMFERRRRILDEARKMIGQDGIEAFSIRELCKRAGVASRTLYYAFDSKENIIALAIRSYFEAFERNMKFDADPSSFDGALEHQVTTTLRNQDIPNYLKAVAALYFSPTLHPNIREVLLAIGGRSWLPWLRLARLQRHLHKGIEIRALLVDLSNLQFAKVHEWGLGALNNDDFLDRTLDAVLVHLAGATKGVALTEVRDALNRLRLEPGYRERLVHDARRRIAVIPGEHAA